MIGKRGKIGQKGFLLYLATLFASLALLIGVFILNTARREVLFSGYAKQSDYAFYAAEAGAECAFYWDLIGVNSRTAFPEDSGDGNAHLASIRCSAAWSDASAGFGFIAPVVVGSNPIFALTRFQFNVCEGGPCVTGGRAYCAKVTVSKIFMAPIIFPPFSSGPPKIYTAVSSHGYNMGCDAVDSTTNRSDKFSRRIYSNY